MSNIITDVSIPKGSIKSCERVAPDEAGSEFQFQKVRLKAMIGFCVIISCDLFQFQKVRLKGSACRGTAEGNGFQFQKVRLKESARSIDRALAQ